MQEGLQEYRSAVRDYMAKHPNATVAEGSEAVLADAAHKKQIAESSVVTLMPRSVGYDGSIHSNRYNGSYLVILEFGFTQSA